MLCEKCGSREAQVRITKIVNGVSEEHFLCQECAALPGTQEESTVSEWSKAIFRLLSDVMAQEAKKNTSEEEEELKGLVCPNCGKTYGEFLEDRTLGCSDCYEAFGPAMGQTILRMQGADTHTGKKPVQGRKRRTPKEKTISMELSSEEEIHLLEEQMNQAAAIEDYKTAAELRDRIKALKEKKNG